MFVGMWGFVISVLVVGKVFGMALLTALIGA
jgi:hypothetical protein